jgi:hypothetical protein
MMVTISLDSPSCEVTLLILCSVVYRDVTRQAKGLYRLKHVGALGSGLAYLSRYNSGWFCHTLPNPLSWANPVGSPRGWVGHVRAQRRLGRSVALDRQLVCSKLAWPGSQRLCYRAGGCGRAQCHRISPPACVPRCVFLHLVDQVYQLMDYT